MRSKINGYLVGMETLRTAKDQDLSNVIVLDGLIHRFEFQFERSIKLIRAMLKYEGIVSIDSPRDVLKEAYAAYDFIDEDVWLDMIIDYVDTKNIPDYSEKQRMLVQNLLDRYLPAFEAVLSAAIEKFPEDAKLAVDQLEDGKKNRVNWKPPVAK